MLGLILLLLFFAALMAAAGSMVGLSLWCISQATSGYVIVIVVGGIIGFACGCVIGFGGIGGGSATGINWHGGSPGVLLPLGILICSVAATLFYGAREFRNRKGSNK